MKNRKQTKNVENEKKNGHLIGSKKNTRKEQSKTSTARLVELDFSIQSSEPKS